MHIYICIYDTHAYRHAWRSAYTLALHRIGRAAFAVRVWARPLLAWRGWRETSSRGTASPRRSSARTRNSMCTLCCLFVGGSRRSRRRLDSRGVGPGAWVGPCSAYLSGATPDGGSVIIFGPVRSPGVECGLHTGRSRQDTGTFKASYRHTLRAPSP